jgi:excisionase family DNA binding protein
MENWIDVSSAAEQLGISERQVRNWIRDGKLKAEKVNSKWRIDGNLEVTEGNPTEALNSDEVEWLRQQVEELQAELSETRKRSDTIILSLTQQLERKTVALEDMRNKSSFWQRIKMGLVRFATPSATEQNVAGQRN